MPIGKVNQAAAATQQSMQKTAEVVVAMPVSEIRNKSVRAELDELAQQHRAISDEIAKLDKLKKPISARIKVIAAKAGLEKVVNPDADRPWALNKVVKRTSSISAEALLGMDVPADVIEAATIEKITEYYEVRRLKVGDDEEGEG